MSWGLSVMLWIAAVFAPIIAWFFWWTWRRKEAACRLFIRERLFAQLTVGVSRPRQILKRALQGAAVLILLVAAARPRVGFHEQEAVASGLDLVVCIDVSKSMLADDVKPNRLTRAKLAAYDLISISRSDRLALVAFAGEAFVQCPLTLDAEAFRQSVESIDTDIIPEQGTAIADGLREAIEAFDKESTGSKAVVVISDGEDQEPGALEVATRAARDGIRIYTMGVGTRTGTILRGTDPYGNPVFVKDELGNAVKSRLDDDLLRKVAEQGNGFYLPLQGKPSVQVLYDRGLSQLPKSTLKAGKHREWIERFQWPLGLAIVLLVMESALSETASGRHAMPLLERVRGWIPKRAVNV